MTTPSPALDAFEKGGERIREAAKWLIASAAAVAAALLAGSQLSSIGKLPLGWPTTVEDARLWVALVGALLGLGGVVFVLWSAVGLLPLVHVGMNELAESWADPSDRLKPALAFLKDHPRFLQGFPSPSDLIRERDVASEELVAAEDEAEIARLKEYVGDLDARMAAIETRAATKVLEGMFKAVLGRLLSGTAATAVGILAFAWAANPPAASSSANLTGANLVGVNLRDAKLTGVDLDGADLSRADLAGADLTGASIRDTRWLGTTCPDGVNSDDVGRTCAGHLSK